MPKKNSRQGKASSQKDKADLRPFIGQFLLPAVSDSNLAIRRKRRQSLALGGLAGLLAILSVGACWYVINYGSLGRLDTAGIEIKPSKTHQQLEQELKRKVDSYKLSVQKPDGSRTQYGLQQLGVTVDIQGAITKAKTAQEQEPLIRRFQWWRHKSLPLSMDVDQEKLQKFIDKQATIVIDPPHNAFLTIKDGQTKITTDQYGTAYIDPAANEKIINSVTSLRPVELKLQKHALRAKITEARVKLLKTRVDAILDQQIVLNIQDKEFIASRNDIAEWIDLPDFAAAKSAEIEINSGKILSYIDQIAKPYVQQTRSEVVMTEPSGQRVVLVKGRNGIDIVDKKMIAVDIANHVFKAEGFKQALAINNAAYDTVDAAGYDKWIVADITNKKMYAYEGSNLIRAFNISAGAPATPTVLGQYKIQAKVRRQDMRGLNTDGSSYFQANVEWVNYFYGSYAIHGNYWRPSTWFGNVNSSHGCIGLMNGDAEWVYSWAPAGTPVITHG